MDDSLYYLILLIDDEGHLYRIAIKIKGDKTEGLDDDYPLETKEKLKELLPETYKEARIVEIIPILNILTIE